MVKQIKLIGALTSKPYAFTARSWELEKVDFIDFFDGLLSNIVIDVRGISVLRVLPRINEKLNEEWISDKIRFSYDGFRRQRLMYPMLKRNNSFVEVSWKEAFFNFFFKYNIENYDYVNTLGVEALYGKFIDIESLYSLESFMSAFKEADTTLKNIKMYKHESNFSSDFLSSQDVLFLNNFDLCVILGSNLRYENPILHLKVLRASNLDKLPILSFFGSNLNKFRHYNFGKKLNSFFNFMEGRSKYSILLSRSKKPLILVGESLKQRVDGKFFSRIMNIVKNKIENLNVSYLLNDVSSLSFFSLYGNRKNKNNFSNKMLFLYNADELNLLSSYKYIVYQGSHGDKGASVADLILPSTFVIEKKGSFVNMFGQVKNYRFVIKPSAQIRTDWRIFKALSLFFDNDKEGGSFALTDLEFSIDRIFPEYTLQEQKGINNFYVSQNFVGFNLRVNNSPIFSSFIDYYNSDVVCRASRVMALSAVRFKNFFINF